MHKANKIVLKGDFHLGLQGSDTRANEHVHIFQSFCAIAHSAKATLKEKSFVLSEST